MKRLVIIGANDFQNQLILKAKEKGFETHVFAWKDGSIGEKTADFFYPISIVEKEQILEICKKIKPDGVCSIASDLATITVNYVAEKLGLTCNSKECTLLSTNKYYMRKAFEKHGDPSPLCYRSDELTDMVRKKLSYPVIVKPVDRSGSRAIAKVNCDEKLDKAILEAEKVSFEKRAIIEEYIEGQEYSVEYISYKGKHTFLALTQKFTTGEPKFIETGHLQPAKVEENILRNVQNVVEHALDTLQIKNGASHSEVKVDEEGMVRIVEIGARMGGDCIGSDLVRISTGLDFVSMVIDVACGMEPSMVPLEEGHEAEIHFIFNQEDIENMEKQKIQHPEQFYRISEIEPFDGHEVTDSSSRYGYYILKK